MGKGKKRLQRKYVPIKENSASSSSGLVAASSSSVTDSSSSVAGPSSSVAGPSSSVAGPSSSVAGPSSSVAGPSSSVAGPSSSVAGPSRVVAASTRHEESRVPPLPERPAPPAYPKDFELMSNRQMKQLMKLQLRSNRGGHGHMKVRVPNTPTPSSRVPPVGNAPDVISRLFEEPTTDSLLAIRGVQTAAIHLSSALTAGVRITRSSLRPPITPGHLRRQQDQTVSADCSSTAEHSDSASQDTYLTPDSPVPSLVFSSTSHKSASACDSSKPSHKTHKTSQSQPNQDDGRVTSAKLRKIAGKFENKKKKNAVENRGEAAEGSKDVESAVKLASDVVDVCSAQVEGIRDEIVGGRLATADDLEILPDSVFSVDIVPILDQLDGHTANLATALEIKELIGLGAGADDIGMVQIPKTVISKVESSFHHDKSAADNPIEAATNLETSQGSQVGDDDPGSQRKETSDEQPETRQLESDDSQNKDTASSNEQQKPLTQPTEAPAEVESDDILVEDGSSSISGDKKGADEQPEAPTIQETASSLTESRIIPVEDDQSSHDPPEVRGKKEDEGGQQTQSGDSSEGTVAVEGSKKESVGEPIPDAGNEKNVSDEKEEAVLEDEFLNNLQKLEFELKIADDHEAGAGTSTDLDSNTSPQPHLCPAQLFCLEARTLCSHLATCSKYSCEEKHCQKMVRVIAHWIHCVENNCAVCSAPGTNDDEKVGEKETLEPKEDSMVEPATLSQLCDYLTIEGQHVILEYYVEYFFEVFVAYNKLRMEAGLRALNFNDEKVPEKLLETVRHSCNCLPFNECRDNQCHRLRMVIAHWSKWNGLCYSTDCHFCDQIWRRSKKERGPIGELVEFISGEMKPGQQNQLKARLLKMVPKPRDVSTDDKKVNIVYWKDSSRMDFKNACINNCLFADAEFGELDGNAMETINFTSLFNKRLTYQLLVLSRYLLYKAISFKEEQFFLNSLNVGNYYRNSMDEGVKLMHAVHTFVKKEFSLLDDTWDNGNEIMSNYKMTQERRYIFLLGSKIGNKMMEFADSMGRIQSSRRE